MVASATTIVFRNLHVYAAAFEGCIVQNFHHFVGVFWVGIKKRKAFFYIHFINIVTTQVKGFFQIIFELHPIEIVA